MTAYRALFAYEELLRRFQNHLANAPAGVEGAFEMGVGFLMSRLHLKTAGLFWWDAQRNSLAMQYLLHERSLMEGEEEIIVDGSNALLPLVEERRPVIVSKRKPWAAYVPLQAGAELLGAVRFERTRPLPGGRAMMGLPPMLAPVAPHARTHPLLEDIGDILSLRLNQLTRDEKHRKRAQYLQAGYEVANAVFERPRLRDMLESVSRSIVHHLGFDRIRIFLVAPDGTRLDGVLGLQIPDRQLDLSAERYPLVRGANSLVDVVMAEGTESTVHLVGGRIVYVPLIVNGQTVGCLSADNLLSQQLVDEEQMDALRTLAGQIAMAILNARLFEDIEQQAITDGLTKLYVHRYFQQRLKEEIDRADRYAYSVALMMMDVDDFKKINDRHGHLTGDRILELLSQCIRSNIRRIDLAARYGGDEVVLVLPEITEEEARAMGERLQAAIRKCQLEGSEGETISLNVTIGAAMYGVDARSARDLIDAADKALYWAKKNMRGSVRFFGSIPSTA